MFDNGLLSVGVYDLGLGAFRVPGFQWFEFVAILRRPRGGGVWIISVLHLDNGASSPRACVSRNDRPCPEGKKEMHTPLPLL